MEIKERSELYSLEPIGKNTPYIESLSGYITRLSNSHCITTSNMISKIIAPKINKNYINDVMNGASSFFASSFAINSTGLMAKQFAEAMMQLTLRSDLEQTTLLKLNGIVPNKGVLRKKKAWCPQCFEEMESNGVLYEPLIWNLKIMKVCLIHKSPLTEVCPHCKKQLNFIQEKSVLGYCPKCIKWLGSTVVNCENEFDETSIKHAEFVLSFLTYVINQEDVEYIKNNITQSFKFIIDKTYNSDLPNAAKALNISLSSVHRWYRGGSLIALDSLMKICLSFNITFEQFINKEIPESSFLNTKELITIRQPDKAKIKKKYSNKEIKETLDAAIESKINISIKQIASTVGCDRKTIFLKYPNEYQIIVNNYKNFRETEHRKKIAFYSDEIEKAFYLLVNRGEYPSNHKIEKIIGYQVQRVPLLKEKIRKLKLELNRSHN